MIFTRADWWSTFCIMRPSNIEFKVTNFHFFLMYFSIISFWRNSSFKFTLGKLLHWHCWRQRLISAFYLLFRETHQSNLVKNHHNCKNWLVSYLYLFFLCTLRQIKIGCFINMECIEAVQLLKYVYQEYASSSIRRKLKWYSYVTQKNRSI